MRPARLVPLAFAALLSPLSAQQGEPVDAKAVEILRKHGLEQSQVMEHLSWICDVHGPRLTGSPGLRRAQDWAADTFRAMGLQNVHFAEWGPFGLGWQLERFSMQVVGENPWPVHGYPKAWSPGILEGAETVAEIVDVSGVDRDALLAMDLTGKIVMLEPPREVEEPFDAPARRLDTGDLLGLANSAPEPAAPSRRNMRRGDFRRTAQVLQIVYDKKPLAIIDRYFKGDYGTVFVSRASLPSDPDTPWNERPRAWAPGDAQVIPQITLAVEHYNRIHRLLQRGVPVEAKVQLQAAFFDENPMERNVIGEIPGADERIGDEVVMIGAHFDSWHTGTGATDNGCGSAVMIEAMRLLTVLQEELGRGPRRTIRIGLWSGEEQGLLGSRAYVAERLAVPGERGKPPVTVHAAHEDFAGYFNLDNGTGRIRGVYLQGNEAVRPIFQAWLRPFHDLDAATLTIDDTGGTDHLAFDAVGLPGFQFIQDPAAYSTRTHHSNMDNWDHAIAADLQQAATIIASFAWHAANRDEKLPRKPMPEPAAEASGGVRRGG